MHPHQKSCRALGKTDSNRGPADTQLSASHHLLTSFGPCPAAGNAWRALQQTRVPVVLSTGSYSRAGWSNPPPPPRSGDPHSSGTSGSPRCSGSAFPEAEELKMISNHHSTVALLTSRIDFLYQEKQRKFSQSVWAGVGGNLVFSFFLYFTPDLLSARRSQRATA